MSKYKEELCKIQKTNSYLLLIKMIHEIIRFKEINPRLANQALNLTNLKIKNHNILLKVKVYKIL